MRLTFLGGTGTVTGSKYEVESGNLRLLVDCGLFQGLKQLRLKNRSPLPVPIAGLDAVLLTHAHLDHSGYLPKLVRDGFDRPIYCTPATRDLCRILLSDSAKIMEEEAEYARRHRFSRHADPLPLYTAADAERAMRLFRPVDWNRSLRLPGGLEAEFFNAGHILGASMIRLKHQGGSLLFSGDLGRQADPLFPPPHVLPETDTLVVESTYGDRRHDAADPGLKLSACIADTFRAGGMVLIPSFAVGRTQSLLLRLWELKRNGALPEAPIFVDSPMATNVTELYAAHPGAHSLGADRAREVFSIAHYVREAEESKAISRRKGPMILISASGMATGGRILHHLKAFAPDGKNTLLLSGYQAAGTRGAALAAGADRIKIQGEYVPVAARIEVLENLSAHADAGEILEWLGTAVKPPSRVFITHGEPVASDCLRKAIEEKLGWACSVPEYRDSVDLGG
ncbi:MAG TPA: MBL fold metallo-hydrolase [Fibrobacteria bacterium]|nr:MBL fold metallo-hydrolase [Fibrobacteria bacterium]